MIQTREANFCGPHATVRTALNGADALAIVPRWRPDVLVLDIGMPVQDGYELLPRLRHALDADRATLPAIAVTGFAAPEDSERTAAGGFQAHVAKAFDMALLCRLIARLAAQVKRSPRASTGRLSRPPQALP